MPELEWYVLGEDDQLELIVNVTEIRDTSRVTNKLGEQWTWDSYQLSTLPAEEEGEEPTEWMTLIGARRRVVEVAA